MTVAELIEKLKEYPPEYIVYCLGDYGDYIAEAHVVEERLSTDEPKGIILADY